MFKALSICKVTKFVYLIFDITKIKLDKKKPHKKYNRWTQKHHLPSGYTPLFFGAFWGWTL